MSTSSALAARIANAPYDSSTGHRRFVVDATPDNVTDLALGAYDVYNGGTVTAYLRQASAVSIPADKAAEVSGQFPVPPNARVTFVASSTTLHFVTASGSTTLEILRRPL